MFLGLLIEEIGGIHRFYKAENVIKRQLEELIALWEKQKVLIDF